MSIDDKKKALIDAGVKVRSNASDETIEELWAEHEAKANSMDAYLEQTSEVSSFENPPAVVDDGPTGPHAPTDDKGPIGPRTNGAEAFNAFLIANQNPQMGDKTPAVIEWARQNLSAEEFKARYDGRVLPV